MENAVFYFIEHAPAGDVARRYEGMSNDVVLGLIGASGNAFSATDEAGYLAALAAAPQDKQ